MFIITMIIPAMVSPFTNFIAPSIEPKRFDSLCKSSRFLVASSGDIKPALKSASIVICLPGIASNANLAATSAIRSAPFVITINCTTVIIKKITPPTTMLPPVTNVPNASITSPASPFARINLVDAIERTSLNIVPNNIIDGNAANSRVFCTYKAIIKSTIPRVIFKLMEKFITQVGISTSKINSNVNTKTAKKISLIGLLPELPCAIKFLSKPH